MKLQDDAKQYMMTWLKYYIEDNCVYRVKPGEPNLPPLHPSQAQNGYSWLILSRKGLMNRKFLNYMGVLFWDIFAEEYKKQPFQITGLETACIPMITAINMTSALYDIEDLNCFYIRKEKKKYGLFQQFEGNILENVPALIIDDFYNSRSTFLTAKNHLEAINISIYNKAFALINKSWEEYKFINDDEFRKNIRKELGDVEIISLFKISELAMDYRQYHISLLKRVDI